MNTLRSSKCNIWGKRKKSRFRSRKWNNHATIRQDLFVCIHLLKSNEVILHYNFFCSIPLCLLSHGKWLPSQEKTSFHHALAPIHYKHYLVQISNLSSWWLQVETCVFVKTIVLLLWSYLIRYHEILMHKPWYLLVKSYYKSDD